MISALSGLVDNRGDQEWRQWRLRAVIAWLLGVGLNSSIVAIYFREWTNNQQFNVCGKIIFSMALLNDVLQCFTTIHSFMFHMGISWEFNSAILATTCICYTSLIYGNFWQSAWLSVYYCLKLINYSNWFFLQVKKALSSSISQILVVSLVGIVFMNLPLIWLLQIERLQNGTNILFNDTQYLYFSITFGCGLPLLVSFVCIGLSVTSLLRHVWRLHQRSSRFSSSPQIQGHLRAARTMILQLSLNAIHFLAVNRLFSSSFSLGIVLKIILWTFFMCFTSLQAMTSILGNPKLHHRFFYLIVSSSKLDE
ncbi:taste receptor type 2 member 140-like [Hyperolius riggenbachi]|uniref:taste receptor type 2 member 140-like n=1 Tax=Hyperolius riggenbachi TaxID=752182 RepID=UPI0035A3C547